jgi:lipoprotein-releasing system permease protein
MLEYFVAKRYLRAKRRESFISVIAGFSLIGIGLGVATLIVVMSVMNGFRHELIGRILGLNGHISIYSHQGALDEYDYRRSLIANVSGVQSITPLIEGQVLITHQGAATGAVVRGVMSEDLKNKTILYNSINELHRSNFQGNQILIGTEMARRFDLRVGDVMTLISPKPKNTPFGSMPRSKAFRVGGVFDVGMFEYNNSFIFMPLETAQLFFEMPADRVSMLEVVTIDPQQMDTIKPLIERRLGDSVLVQDWRDNNSSFFNALQVERNVMFLILTLIILVAAFNIISSLIMLVKDKSHDIAILRTMGATRGQILRIFLLTGATIGVVGTLAGALLGIMITTNLQSIQHGLESLLDSKLFPAEIYFLSKLPAIIDWQEVVSVIVMALVLSFGATIYPAWRAAKLNPVEALRYA